MILPVPIDKNAIFLPTRTETVLVSHLEDLHLVITYI